MKQTVALECKHFGAGRRLRLVVWRNAEYKFVYLVLALSGISIFLKALVFFCLSWCLEKHILVLLTHRLVFFLFIWKAPISITATTFGLFS
jgi:hypothetical protein